MDGEVNNRTARIAQDVKRDNTRQTQETDAGDGQHETDAGDGRDRQPGTLKGVRRLKELVEIKEGKG